MMIDEGRIRVQLYEPSYKAQWDEFVRQSKNSVFLFFRDYLEYHADRFSDFSLLFFQDDKLIALMPANRTGDIAASHDGLTFGGVVSAAGMTTPLMLEVFSALVRVLRAHGIRRLVYKAIPHIYHRLPAEEDLYALFVHNARLFRRDISSTVFAGQRLPLATSRRKISRHVRAQGLKVSRSENFPQFMAIAEAALQSRHGVRPVHTAQELQLLARRFPENIKLFIVDRNSEMLGGVVIYESEMVAHGQYGQRTPEGMELGAVDYLIDVLLNDVYRDKPYFDFGISSVDNGRSLNEGLIRYKESFGARATVYDFYELNLEA